MELISHLARWFGGDPYTIRRAAHELDEQAERIQGSAELMWAELNQVWWRGHDADRFRADWDQIHRRASHQIANELHRLANDLRREATRQQRASDT